MTRALTSAARWPAHQTQRRGLYGKYAFWWKKARAYCFCDKAEAEEGASFEKEADPAATSPRRRSRPTWTPVQPHVIRQKIPHDGSTTFSDVTFGEITVENSTWTTRSC